MLELKGLCKRFHGQAAVGNVSITLQPGEFFALLGPSGCGKTTLLRMIAGLEIPDSGSIAIAGQDVTALPAQLRPVNTVFQSYALFPHLNVFENIAFGLRMKRLDQLQLKSKVNAALEMVRMQAFGKRRVTELSGGEQQRVALARALVNEPKVLLLDEPLSALDLHLRRMMQQELRLLQRQLGTLFIVVTHDPEEAFALADRIGVMLDGGIAQCGTPEELYRSPKDARVASFLGRINQIEQNFLRPEHLTLRVASGSQSTSTIENDGTIKADRSAGVKSISGKVLNRQFSGDHWEYLIGASIQGKASALHSPVQPLVVHVPIQNVDDRIVEGGLVEVSWDQKFALCFKGDGSHESTVH